MEVIPKVLQVLKSLRIKDIVDIGIVSFVLFRFYMVFQGTNIWRILVGLSVLWLLQYLAASAGIILTSWALQGITAAAAIIIIVVFRNEIRSALLVTNISSFFWGSPRYKKKATSPDIITDTVYYLARNGIGALIVFPGNEDISELLSGGIDWDGKLSQEMIVSIFQTSSPVHDGAIIIEGSKIKKVATILPLTQRQDIPTFYGTRHRAALGLVEQSDALVVVVSEERGEVSVAKNGNIKWINRPQDFKKVLMDHLGLSAPSRRPWRKIFTQILIFSVFLSITVGVWYGFTRSRDTLIAISVPVEYINRPQKYEILDTSTNEVKLEITGPSRLVRGLRPEQVVVRVDLSTAAEGTNTFPITKESISIPPGLTLVKVRPGSVTVILDIVITKDVPIQAQWVGKLPPGKRLVSALIMPPSVKIVGGKAVLKKIQTIYTSPIRLNDLVKSGTVTAKLVLVPASIDLAPGEKDVVDISYIIVDDTRVPPDDAGGNQ